MFPSCGCSQLIRVVGMGPKLSRSICVASSSSAPEGRVPGDRSGHQGVPDLIQHLLLRAADDRDEREHVFEVGGRRIGALAMDHGRAEPGRPVPPDEPRPAAQRGGHLAGAAPGDAVLDVPVDGPRNARDGKRRQRALRVVGRPRGDRRETLGERRRDVLRMAGGPYAGTGNAAPSAVLEHTVGQHLEVVFPVVHHVVAEQDLGETGSVDADGRVASVTLHGGAAPEDEAARGALHDPPPPPRRRRDRPRSLPGGSRRQRTPPPTGRGSTVLPAPASAPGPIRSGITGSQRVWTPGEFEGSTHPRTGVCGCQDTGTPRASNPCPAARISRSSPRVSASRTWSILSRTNLFFSMFARHIASGNPVVADWERTNAPGRLPTVAEGQVRLEVEPGGLSHHGDQIRGGDLAQRRPRAAGAPDVPGHHPGGGLIHLGHRLAGQEMGNGGCFEAVVGTTPAEDGNAGHGAPESSRLWRKSPRAPTRPTTPNGRQGVERE